MYMGFREKSLRKKGFRGQWEEVREKKKKELTRPRWCCECIDIRNHMLRSFRVGIACP